MGRVNGTPDPVSTAVRRAQQELAEVDTGDPAAALPHLRAAQDHLTAAIDEAMAVAVVEGQTLRSAGLLAGLSENAVGPRLARTSLLAAYGSSEGKGARVTASGVERARYDVEQGRHKALPDADRPPMRFRPRRTT
jgi:hypothetical protein